MTPKEVVMAYAQALGKGDITTAFSFFNPTAKWNQPGNNQFSGTKNGTDKIGEMLGGMMEVTNGTFAVNPNGNLTVNGNLVIMPVRFTGKLEDRNIDMAGFDLFDIQDGKIEEVWLFSDDQKLEDEFWGK